MLTATLEERAAFECLCAERERTRWPERNWLPPIADEAYPFLGYTVTVSWQDGRTFRWHVESIPDQGQLEAMHSGVRLLTYSAD
jgi:hypothetical protein